MPNSITKAQEFYHALLLVKTQNYPKIKGERKTKFDSIVNQINDITNQLIEIDENEVSQEYVEIEESSNKILSENLEFWKNLKPGRIKNAMEGGGLKDHSKTIDALFRKAVDIPIVHKFSDEEKKLATEMAELSFHHPKGIYKMIKTIERESTSIPFLTSISLEGVYKKFFRYLERLAIIKSGWKSNSIEKTDKEGKKYTSICFENILSTGEKPQLLQFLHGDWFNAYTYEIISDHLDRNKYYYEIYTKVNYKAPEYIFAASGDFDILAMIEDTILLVECKSGREFDKDEIIKFIKKTNGLKEVFKVGKTYKYIFMFVYTQDAIIDEWASEQFRKSEIKSINISELTKTIVNIFSKEL